VSHHYFIQGLNVSVAGIPKTIDNDIDHIDRTFGFDSAVEAAQVAIRSAKTEAVCNLPNGRYKYQKEMQ
jgi:6-phosphofructokinase 1